MKPEKYLDTLLEMPHMTIGDETVDLQLEKEKNPFYKVISVFKGFSPEQIKEALHRDKFALLSLRKHFNTLSDMQKQSIIQELENNDLGFIQEML